MRNGRLLLTLALVALVVMLAAAWFDPRDAAAAWLFAFVLVAGAPIGALSLRLVGRLTGGAWFASIEPALVALSLLAPLTAVGAIVVLLSAPMIYPWAIAGAHEASVGYFYLNAPLVVLRTVVAFAGWTVLGFDLVPAEGQRGQIAAGLGLVFHAVITTFVAYDWLLALTPGFTSSAFGAETVIVWMLSALALAIIFSPDIPRKATYDLAGLTVALVMGAGYMVFFQFLIVWYGDLPDTVTFYLGRSNPLGIALLLGALFLGLVVPLLCLAFEPVRGSIGRLRVVAGLILAGIVSYRGWNVLPLFGVPAVVLAPVAVVLFLSFLLATRRLSGRFTRRALRETRHG